MILRLFLASSCLAFLTNCASVGEQWRGFLDGGARNAQPAKVAPRPLTYSEQNNLDPSIYRHYHRTTKADLQNAAHLEDSAGSLWVMQGQGAYLFSQNVVRMVGDPIAVKLNGDPVAQLTAKANVIAKLLAQLEMRRRMAEGMVRAPASQAKAKTPQNSQASNGAATPNGTAAKSNFNVKLVPTRVVERLTDGDYRVRGMQPFLIGQRQYKVIVSGIVRAEDFNDQGISATQLLDSRFDIVSARGAEMRQ